MNNEKQTNPESKTGLIDRRFFLKASSATLAVATVGGLLATAGAENQIPAAKDGAVAENQNNETIKHWKAGWMAF